MSDSSSRRCEFKLSTSPYPYEDHHASTIIESTTNLIYESEVESESVKGDLSRAAVAEVHGTTEGAGAVVAVPQKAQVQWSQCHRRRRCGGRDATKGAGAVVAAPQKAQVRRYATPQKAQVQWSRHHRRHRCGGHGTTEGTGAVVVAPQKV